MHCTFCSGELDSYDIKWSLLISNQGAAIGWRGRQWICGCRALAAAGAGAISGPKTTPPPSGIFLWMCESSTLLSTSLSAHQLLHTHSGTHTRNIIFYYTLYCSEETFQEISIRLEINIFLQSMYHICIVHKIAEPLVAYEAEHQ